MRPYRYLEKIKILENGLLTLQIDKLGTTWFPNYQALKKDKGQKVITDASSTNTDYYLK